MPDYSSFFTLVGVKDIQTFLNTKQSDEVLRVDGFVGRKTWRVGNKVLLTAILNGEIDLPEDYKDGGTYRRTAVAIQQYFLKEHKCDPGKVDGYVGPNTLYAVECWQDKSRSIPLDEDDDETIWPHERNVEAFYGKPGRNHVQLYLPYPMRLAWDKSTVIHHFAINKKCADSARRILERVLAHYGDKGIRNLGLDLFAGCYSNRSKRGGTTKSMHAYACAIDFDSANNQLRWGKNRARFAQPEYNPWWTFWEDEGWVSLGRERNYDWMHVQAAQI